MSIDESAELGTFAKRLEHLFATIHPANRGQYTNREVADEINQAAGRQVLSHTYLWQLRSGKRDKPSHDRVVAIAEFFGVSPAYFSDDDIASRTDAQLQEIAILRDRGVRGLALRAQGLSDKTIASFIAMMDNAREIEGLPRLAADDTQGAAASPASGD
jgi:transcriptional regulator with XRE-family HTH domain